jgi:hypothetical protein
MMAAPRAAALRQQGCHRCALRACGHWQHQLCGRTPDSALPILMQVVCKSQRWHYKQAVKLKNDDMQVLNTTVGTMQRHTCMLLLIQKSPSCTLQPRRMMASPCKSHTSPPGGLAQTTLPAPTRQPAVADPTASPKASGNKPTRASQEALALVRNFECCQLPVVLAAPAA